MPEWLFPISPVAASRPRLCKRGAYFAGPYKYFRKEMIELVPMILGNDFDLYTGPLKVDLELFVRRPKKTKLMSPKADIDNYIKAVFDCLNGKLWEDDTQILEVYAVKQWTKPTEDGYFILGVDQLQ